MAFIVSSFCTDALLRPKSLVTSPREVSTIFTSELIPSRNEGVGVRWTTERWDWWGRVECVEHVRCVGEVGEEGEVHGVSWVCRIGGIVGLVGPVGLARLAITLNTP